MKRKRRKKMFSRKQPAYLLRLVDRGLFGWWCIKIYVTIRYEKTSRWTFHRVVTRKSANTANESNTRNLQLSHRISAIRQKCWTLWSEFQARLRWWDYKRTSVSLLLVDFRTVARFWKLRDTRWHPFRDLLTDRLQAISEACWQWANDASV